MAKRRPKWELELEALQEEGVAREVVERALGSDRGVLVAQAARVVERCGWRELEPALIAAYERLCDNAVKRDPGCLGKQAVLDVLDRLDTRDEGPFLSGIRYVQREPAYPKSVDTAGGIRSRSAAALARLRHPDVLLFLGKLLADPEPPVRRAAAETLAYHGDPAGAALLIHKIAIGDEDPMVHAEAMTALLDLSPRWAVDELRPLLFEDDPELQELVSVVLGQHREPAALELLRAWYEALVLADHRAVAIRAIGLHRSDRARAFLLELVATGSAPIAKHAIEALAVHAYDTRLRDDVMKAAGEHGEPSRIALAKRAFAHEDDA